VGIVAYFRRKRALARLGSRPALRSLTAVDRWRRALISCCYSTGFTLLVVASAGPQWGYDPEPALASGRDLVLVLDVSRSMLAEDLLPSRLVWAQQAVLQLVDDVQRRGGHRLGLVVFAGRARVICPLTPDYDHFREAVRNVDPGDPRLAPQAGEEGPASGTRIGQALTQAVELHEPRFRDFQDIVLLSDGDDPARDDEWHAGVQAARAAGIPIHTVGVGNPDADSEIRDEEGRPLLYEGRAVLTRLQKKPLEDIARWTGGVYLPAWNERRPLGTWFRSWVQGRPSRELSDDPLPALEPRYAWFFGPALALLALGMLVSDRPRRGFRTARRPAFYAADTAWLVPLALLLVSAFPARDADVLLRLGNEAFDQGAYAQAVELYARAEEYSTDPGLVALNQAAALYRLGRYREAELHYVRALEDAAGPRRARALFDLGNALVQACRGSDVAVLDRAIGFYEVCLKEPQAPPALHEDAQHNLQLAQALRQRAKHSKKESPTNSNSKPAEEDPGHQQPSRVGAEPGADAQEPAGQLRHAEGESGQGDARAAQQRQPGTGNLPPIPDSDEPITLAPEDALAHLQRATQRILNEQQNQKLRTGRPTRNVLDW